VVRASQWVWPHNNSIQAIVKESGDYAGLRCPTWKGQRLWWLFAPTLAPCDIAYVTRYAWEGLDKLNHEFLLDWPGQKGSFAGMNFYDGGQMNPTGGIRGAGRRALADAGKAGDFSTLTRVQVMMHPDAYGSYWNFWSPENPNFFTDFMRVPIALTAQLKGCPHFETLRRAAEAKLREDMAHSVTLHGGAGQEHMHNRVAFGTVAATVPVADGKRDACRYANMDGYERLIAFKTSPVADVAIGQVESERLRQVEKLPPEIWHQEYPQHPFAKPLVYRRTIVLVKGGPQDYFVIRDQFWASEPLAPAEINLDRSQGDIGLFVPDAGYPFGELPDWLIRPRARRP